MILVWISQVGLASVYSSNSCQRLKPQNEISNLHLPHATFLDKLSKRN